jgi:hypothetical protein
MTREERVKICETCKHCQKDIERGILCGLTNEYADFEGECNLFEPSEQQQEETRANRVVARMKAMTRIGLSSYPYAFGIGVYFFIVACLGFTTSEDYGPIITCLFLLSTGFVLAMVIGADYYFLRYKRKKKIFGELTRKGIEEVLKFEGFYPQKGEKNGEYESMTFKSNGIIYEIYYNTPQFIIRGCCGIDNGNYQLAQSIASKITTERLVIKVHIIELAERQGIGVNFMIETLIHYTDELKIGFANYLDIINNAISNFYEEYEQLQRNYAMKKRNCKLT